jgi:molecular chaperone Hsp33
VGRHGVIAVVRDVGFARPFSGQTPIVDGEIDTDVENYLTTSEQIESALACDALLDDAGSVSLAAGILVQALPGAEHAARVIAHRAALRAGALTRALQRTLQDGGLPSLDAPAQIAERVLADEAGSLEVLDVRPVRFFCHCTRERAAASLAMLGEADLTSLLTEEGRAEVTCEFCREAYVFDAPELMRVRDEARGHADPPS